MSELYDRLADPRDPVVRRLGALLAAANDVVTVFDEKGAPLYRSPAFARVLGYAPEEVRESSPFEYVHPDDVEPAEELLAWALAHPGERSDVLEFRMKAADGSWRFCEGTMTNLLEDAEVRGVVGNWRDVTRVREAERLVRQLVDSIDGVFWMRDVREDRFLYLSPSIEEKLGIPRDEAMADPDAWIEAIHPDDRERVREARLRGAVEDEQEYRVARGDRTRWIRDHGFPVHEEGGEIRRVAGIALDVTERKRAQEALRASEQRFVQAQKMEAIGRLAGGIAHDFNNLLTAIQGYGHLVLERDDLDPEIRANVEEIDRAAGRAADLTAQLLAYGRRQEQRLESVDVNQAIREFARMIERVLPDDIALESRLGADPATVRIDPGKLEQVLMNLAVNARDAMPEGGALTISTETIVRRSSGEESEMLGPGAYVRLRVIDTGTGMEPDTASHAFEPFYTTKPTGEGTGLGLSTVYGIVTQVGGEARIESEPGEGTEIRIELPLETDQAGPTEPAGRAGRADATAPSDERGGVTILLVEDEARIRRLGTRVLRDAGYRVLSARSGDHALDLVEAEGVEPDLVLTDVVMPGRSGPELIAALNERGHDPDVVYMTGFPESRLEREERADAGAILSKPFTPSELVRRVGEALGADSG